MPDMREVFDPRQYLRANFPAPSEDDCLSLKFWINHICHLPDGVRALEYGGGPALYSVLALARKASTIHFSDHVPANLAEIRRWLVGHPDAYDWRPYTRLILKLEGSPNDDDAIAKREAALRRQMIALSEGDARVETMLVDPRSPYDVITAHHCLDVAAHDLPDFKRMVLRLAEMLTPRGLFLLSITTGTTTYTVDGVVFPCLDLTPEQVCESLVEAGLDPDRIEHITIPVASEEYTAMHHFAGWKR